MLVRPPSRLLCNVRYCHVYKVGPNPTPHSPALSYVRKGISKINATAVIKLVSSLRVGGGDSALDRLEGFLKFAAFLLGDVAHNCLNTTATAVTVEYFWSSDGTNGVLLGMVRRPVTILSPPTASHLNVLERLHPAV